MFDGYAYEDSDDWYRFVFVDGGGSCCQNIEMRKDLIRQTTYARWVGYGTLYGLSRYSLVCLTEASNFNRDKIRGDMQSMYYQMMLFLLAQRASIIGFSSQISLISREIDNYKAGSGRNEAGGFNKIAEKVRTLHGDFIGFVNRLWFEEVTPQEQGIEMYSMGQKNMGLKDQIRELKEEMQVLYDFVEMQYSRLRADEDKLQTQEDKKLNIRIFKLTLLAAVSIPFSLVIGFWGMNFAFTQNKCYIWFVISLVIIGVSIWLLYGWVRKDTVNGGRK
jgi:hypothetical protein